MVTKRLYLYGSHDWSMIVTFLLYVHTALIFSVINVAWIDLIRELGISYTFVGLIAVVGAGLSMVSMLLGGSIVGRFGARKTLIVTVPILVISHACLALAPSQTMLFAVNVGWGWGSAPCWWHAPPSSSIGNGNGANGLSTPSKPHGTLHLLWVHCLVAISSASAGHSFQ